MFFFDNVELSLVSVRYGVEESVLIRALIRVGWACDVNDVDVVNKEPLGPQFELSFIGLLLFEELGQNVVLHEEGDGLVLHTGYAQYLGVVDRDLFRKEFAEGSAGDLLFLWRFAKQLWLRLFWLFWLLLLSWLLLLLILDIDLLRGLDLHGGRPLLQATRTKLFDFLRGTRALFVGQFIDARERHLELPLDRKLAHKSASFAA